MLFYFKEIILESKTDVSWFFNSWLILIRFRFNSPLLKGFEIEFGEP